MFQFKPIARLGDVVSFLLAGQLGVILLGLLPESVWNFDDGAVAEDDVVGLFAVLAGALGLVGVLVAFTLGTWIMFLVWMNRAAKNARVLLPEARFEFTPGWCVGWWFVPFANLIKPFQAMKEIYQASLAANEPKRDGGYAPVLVAMAVPATLQLWWGGWVGSTIIDRVTASSESMGATMLSTAFTLFAGVMCVIVVRTISQLQTQASTRLQSGSIDVGHVANRG